MNRISFMIILSFFAAILIQKAFGIPTITASPDDDDDDWDEDDSSSEADDDSRIYKNPRNSPSTECPRDEEQATLLGQKCLRKCSSDEDCKSKKKKCLCDGVCGMSCIKPDRECPELSQPSLGTVILSGRLFGARATYTCPHGYHVVGLQSRLCQADGHWAGAEPACKENIYCLTPPNIEHARHSALPEQETFDLDSTVQYHCHTGYVTNGFPRAKCLAIEGHASWYGPDIQCEPRSCGQPSDPANGWHAGECYTFGCRITYHCGEGYELVGKQERYCQADGSWTPKELPTCVLVTSVQCPVPENPKNGKVIYTTFSYNSVVSYECRYGYTLVGESSRRCGADRKWSGSLPTCKEINCGIPGILYNGWLENIEAGTGLGASIIFRCHPEMLLQGHSSTVCQIDGRWRYSVPECLAPCIVPTISQGTVIPIEVEVDVNATTISTPPVVITSTGKVKHGTSLEVSCDEHYEFPVSSLSPPTCNNGTWTVIPRCIPARCKSMPKPPKNGMVIAPKTEHGMKARFKCKDGYNITGPGGKEITDPNIYVLTCSFGNWTGETPQCQEVYCSFPGHIPNGKVLLVGNMGLYDYRPYVKKIVNNKQIMYDCDKGYVLEEGPPGATCVGGKWRPTELPKCLLGQHPRLRFNRRRRSIQLKYLRSKFLLQEARKLNKWMTENCGIKLSNNDHSSIIIRKKRNIHNLPFIPHKISTNPTQQLTSYSKRFISRLFPKFKRLENVNLKWNKRIPDNFHENSIEFQKPLNRIRDVFIKYYDKMKRRDKNYAMCLFKDCNLQNDIFSYQQNLQTSDYHKRMIQPFYEQRYGFNDYPKLTKRHKPISKTNNNPISPTSLIAKRLINENNQESNHINNPTIAQNETMIKPTIDQIFYQLFIANRKNVSHPYINKNKTFPIISIVSDTVYRCDSRSKNSVNCHGNSTIFEDSAISKFKTSQKMRRSKRDALINSSNSTDNETASVNNNGTMTAIDREPSEDRKGRGPRGPCEELKDENFLNITVVRQGKSIGQNSPGTILHLVCNPGFKLNIKNPNATARCVRGIWKPQKPACLSASCSVPSTEHGKYFEIVSESNSNLRLLMPYEEIGNDQIIAFECEQGYNIHGPNQLQCVHGSWSISNFPECVPLPCILPTIPNVIYEGGYRAGLTIAHGSSVSVHCDNPVNNLPLQMICNKGLMSPNTIHCETGGSRKSREEYLGEAEFSGGEHFLNALMNNGHKITSVETKSNVTERGINVTNGRDCGSPIQVDGSLVYKNGEPVDPDDSYPSGTEISFNCIASIAGERNTWKIICEDGNWIGRSLSCANGTCLFKNNDPNVVSFYNDLEIREDVVEFPPGATIISRCVDIGKYAMVGSGERTCIHSEWSGQKPVCYGLNQENDYAMEKPPTILFRHQNGPIAQSNDGKLIVYPGTTVHMECLWMRRFGNPKWNVNHDYRNYPEGWVTEEGRDPQLEYRLSILHAVEDDSGIYTCQTPARHEHSVEVVVKAINCPDIPIRRGLIVSSNDTKLSSRILLSCANGNSLIGASELFCLPSGNWSAPLPVCESVECGDIPLPIMNSTTPRVAVLSREVGGRAAFSCPSGYGLRGPSESICLPSGEWATPFPTCVEVQCDNPGAPQNGYAQGSSPYRAGDVVQFNCNPEYMMQGQPIIACQDNGRWSGGLPKCVQACSYPGTAISGRMSSVKFYYAIGESITFTCDAGLELRGAKMLKCLRNGKWSNAIPTCVNSTQANKTSEQVIG